MATIAKIFDDMRCPTKCQLLIYAKFRGKLIVFMEQMYDAKSELDKTFGTFSRVLRPVPLPGRRNEEVVRNRGNALAELQ